MENKALFLDRDGTINEDLGYVIKPEDFKFTDGILDVCKKAQDRGFIIIVISNQSGVERGYFSKKDVEKLNEYMISEFKKHNINIQDIFYCPKLSGKDRKPESGMFFKAEKKYNIDMSKSVSIGDKERDIEAARNAGVGRNYLFSDTKENTKADLKIDNLYKIGELL